MPPPQVTNDFVELLEKSRLLTHDQISDAFGQLELAEDASPVDVATSLVRSGRLTRFQADRLLEGRHRGFFIDHYRCDHILGTGGMGWLYLATDVDSGNMMDYISDLFGECRLMGESVFFVAKFSNFKCFSDFKGFLPWFIQDFLNRIGGDQFIFS